MISAVVYVMEPEICARKVAGYIVWTVAEGFDLVCVLGLAGLGGASTSSEESISGVNDSSHMSDVMATVNQTTKINWKSMVIVTCCHYILLRISVYYFLFLTQ